MLGYKIMPKEIFIVENQITLQAAILDCSEAAVHSRLQKILVVESFFWTNYKQITVL